jgi:type II secretory pathway component PulJ
MRLSITTGHRLPRRGQRGIGLIELMVGITVGLIVTAGAALVATKQINEHRRLMLEVQMQQDLRVAADLIQQDLRRAGYRGFPANGVWEPEHMKSALIPAKDPLPNPYAALTVNAAGDTIEYRYARDGAGGPNTTNIVADDEKFAVRLVNKTLYLQKGIVNGQRNWQPITDPDVVEITGFQPSIVTQQVPLDELCICPAGGCAAVGMTLRRVNITIEAVSKSDAAVKRTLQISEKIRADDVSPSCP